MAIENVKTSEWRGYERLDFEWNGKEAILVKPRTAAEGTPWVWRAEFFSAFDSVDMDLLANGWHIAYVALCDRYGCPSAVDDMKAFRDEIVPAYGLAPKCAMFGFSRGGLYTVNYTAAHPEDIAAIYLDAPVCDIRSWPGGFGKGSGDAGCWSECKECYQLDEESAKTFAGNPLDKIQTLTDNKIPCVLCAGLADSVVPWDENGKKFVGEYERLGGEIVTFLKPGCDHHPHSLSDPAPISEFLTVHK